MESPQLGQSMAADEALALEKNAGLVMATNNSSIVSKRSVERLYLPQPHFYRYFVRKPQRRAPTINRGYWLRMRAIDWIVRHFLETATDQRKVVINLGCGYDPIPFQWLSQDHRLCAHTTFIDVDFEELMRTKRDIILDTPNMKTLLSDLTDTPLAQGILLRSRQYVALGCDLRNRRKLERLIRSVVDLDQCLVLCLAEVSITYMATADADALIAWSATLAPDVTFALLEQQSPDRPDNPFTAAMLKHFAKLGTPLRSLLTYPGSHTQTLRFQTAGYALIEIQSLWDLWADPRFLSPSQRMSLDEVEPFDEWEEFALFASHYCLIIAQTGDEPLIPEQPRSRRASVDSFASDLSTRTVSPHRGDSEFYAYNYTANPSKKGRMHHGSAFALPGRDAIGVHGGVGLQSRLSSTAVYSSAEATMSPPLLPPEDIGARCCHTITTLANGQNVLIGGRGSPSAPMRDCWVQTNSKWERVHDLPEPRFRHRAAAVVLPDNQYGVVVFGGKTSATKVALECLLWDPKNGWQTLRSLRSDPMPRFGASFVRLGFNHGLLFGGMRHDGIICQGLWRWRLIIRDNVVSGIRFKASTALDTSAGIYPWLARLGASYSVIRNELLVIGGVAKHGCIPKDYEILSIVGSFSAFGEFEKEMQLRVACAVPWTDQTIPRPFLIGHSTHRTVKETTLIVGGGATCFSFGAYWNQGCWLLYDREQGESSHWNYVEPAPTKSTTPPVPTPTERSWSDLFVLEPLPLGSERGFAQVVATGIPRLLTNLDIGPCVELWSPSYLVSKIPASRSVVVHSSSSRTMNFQRKDFSYVTMPAHDFINRLATDPNAHLYLRSISSTKPTQLPTDFLTDWPELSPDFRLPPMLNLTKQIQHSSPLRVSANINMWLHYDVMANVLFQIRGTRKLILFPPGDIKHLSFPSGATTSTLDVLEAAKHPGEDDTLKSIPHTHPHIAVMKPGDALFIPPMWAHAGTPVSLRAPDSQQRLSQSGTPESHAISADSADSHINISLNIFFRTLQNSKYPVGRDVYGNRDLAAYEDGRKDLDRIFRRFMNSPAAFAADGTDSADASSQIGPNGSKPADKNVEGQLPHLQTAIPRAMAKAYLDRLADELRERAQRL